MPSWRQCAGISARFDLMTSNRLIRSTPDYILAVFAKENIEVNRLQLPAAGPGNPVECAPTSAALVSVFLSRRRNVRGQP